MNSISLSANPFHESLSFSILMFFMQSSAMEGLLKYLSISLLMASGVPSPDSWIKSVNSKFGYIDNKTKTNHTNVEKILPGTAGAVIEIEPRAKKTFYITNIVFEDITEKSLETTAGEVENVQK